MTIRLATEADVEAIVRLGKEMVAESRFARYGMNEAKTRSAIETMIRNPASACILLAVRSDGALAGMLAGYVTEFFFGDATVAQDRWYYVHRRYRGSSAGLKLLLAFRKWAENRKAHELSLNMSVAIDMQRFNRFMTHMGFTCCGSNFFLPLKELSSGRGRPIAAVGDVADTAAK